MDNEHMFDILFAAYASWPIINCTNGKLIDNPTEITEEDLLDALRALIDNYSKDSISGNTYGAGPCLLSFYVLFAEDWIEQKLKKMTWFRDVSLYPFPDEAEKNEIGIINNLRLIRVNPKIDILPRCYTHTIYPLVCVSIEAKSNKPIVAFTLRATKEDNNGQ